MYEADGIDLTQTEFNELRFVLGHGPGAPAAVQARTEADGTLAPAYRKLNGYGLVGCLISFDGTVFNAHARRSASDWLASYERSEREKKRLSRREIKLAVWNTLGGAVSGGLVAWLLYAAFGIGG